MIDAGAVAVAAGVAQRLADGSVVFRPPPGAPAAVQRDADAGGPAGGPPPDAPGEPAPEPAPGPDVAPDAAPESAGAEGDGGGTAPESGQAGGGKGPGGKGGAPAVTDELVRALYPPLSRMLKADLRLERERAGFLIDTRH
ncbi:hypothetical protein IHE55_02155 [Streptomyces pactum]|uniref:Uncharacterized protein n=1 Tax=Streptomyces pactum TaxID=68249 RepID=A0ABS0NES7_9ACTN|nr:hypothetical protein [Streptomyces pactum]MBH5333671.1 hypothetical protein [Streptomyces pactum]